MLEPVLLRGWHRDREPHRIGTLDGLDLDHIRAQGRQVLRRERPGPEGGHVEDADAFEGKRAIGSSGRRPRGDDRTGCEDLTAVLAEARRRCDRRRFGDARPERRARVRETTARVGPEELPCDEVGELGDGRAVADRRGGNAEQCGALDDLARGAVPEPRCELGGDLTDVRLPDLLVVPFGPLDEVRPVDHGEEVVPLLDGDRREPDVAVPTGLDPRHHGEDPVAARPARQRGRHRRVADQGDDQALQARHVDVLAPAGPLRAAPGLRARRRLRRRPPPRRRDGRRPRGVRRARRRGGRAIPRAPAAGSRPRSSSRRGPS